MNIRTHQYTLVHISAHRDSDSFRFMGCEATLKCGSFRSVSFQMRFVPVRFVIGYVLEICDNEVRFGSVWLMRFVRFLRFVLIGSLLLAVRFGSCSTGSVRAVRFRSAAFMSMGFAFDSEL